MKISEDLDKIEEVMPKGLTGAQIFNYVSNAYKKALEEKKEELRAEMGTEDRRKIKKYLGNLGTEKFEIGLNLEHFVEDK